MNQTDMNRQSTAKEAPLLLPVPTLPPERKAPAAIRSIALIKTPGKPDTMRIVIKRDLAVKLESFTFRYRFSSLPVYASDSTHKFYTYLYEDDDINSAELITLSSAIPQNLTGDGCSAYISEIRLTDGQILTFEPSEFRFVRRPVNKAREVQPPSVTAERSTVPSGGINKNPPRNTGASKPASPDKRFRRIIIILAALLAIFIGEIIIGTALSRYLGVRNSTDALIKDNLFNEAYKIAYDSEYESILQNVCEEAVEYYISKGDLESSYVYAYGAPSTSLRGVAIDYAAAKAVDEDTGTINENAFRVAKMTEDDEKFSSIVRSVCEILKIHGDYVNALLVASELRSAEERSEYENAVFYDALHYYISGHRYDEAATFIEELPNIATFDISKESAIRAAFECCATLDDNAGIIYLTYRYPEFADTYSGKAGIDADDPGVRAGLAIIYPVLTEEQKRDYHAQAISVWNENIRIIKSGEIAGTGIKDAVSIDTNGTMSLILRSNGNVNAIPLKGATLPYTVPTYNDVIQVVLGEGHSVLLHADGTVSALGDNTYGQCDVGDWKDIVSVAAGQRFTVGLKVDGTLVATGSNSCGQCDVSAYRNVVDVAACNQTTVMLFSDGTVMVRGYRSMGISDVEKVKNVTRLRAGASAILVEKQDGTYELFSGQIGGSYGNPYDWQNIEAFDVGLVCIAGIDTSGTVHQDGDGLPNN